MSLDKLSLPEDATEEQVKARFRELSRSAHPDGGGSAEAFQQLQADKEEALREVRFGQSLTKASLQLKALREAAKGVKCPRCDGTGRGSTFKRGFSTMTTACRMCGGRGTL